MELNNITLLIAHCDDEVIFGWPVLKQAKKIIVCSTDQNNPERQWCARRIEGLMQICKMIGAELHYLNYNSEFYRLDARNGDLGRFVDEVYSLVGQDKEIFTHNAWGEYGHLDHILVNQIARNTGAKIITTDICADANWFKVRMNSQLDCFSHCVNDLNFYKECQAIYEALGCWTWSQEPVLKTNLYFE